ncbi:hypothetical protein AGMMS49546_00950 [Spirochaetia bacterium]|nr:hypothetical protein AGMMS49546_00950 [Spirochaetia bacterium]
MTRNQKKLMAKDAAIYYRAYQAEIVSGHLDEFAVVKGQQVLGYYGSEDQAFDSMIGDELGTFIVQRCQEPGTDIANYYNNTVAFA